jgi:hypothetical protein
MGGSKQKPRDERGSFISGVGSSIANDALESEPGRNVYLLNLSSWPEFALCELATAHRTNQRLQPASQIQKHGDIGVTQNLAHDFHRHSPAKHQRPGCVPEVVRADGLNRFNGP